MGEMVFRRPLKVSRWRRAGVVAAVLLTLGSPANAQIETVNMTVGGAWNGVAPCLGATETDLRQLEFLSASQAIGGRVIDARVAGYQLRRQPVALVGALQRLSATSGATRQPGSADCTDVHCAARALFGSELGPRAMRILLAFGYNAADRQERVTQPWASSELDEALGAFSDLPASMFPLDDNPRLLVHQHTERTLTGPGMRHYAVAARAGEGVSGILIDQGWHHVGRNERRAIIAHEIAHEFTRTRGRFINWSDIWTEAMRADAAAAEPGAFTFASGYAQTNVDEDFAESFAAYRYMAQTLKRRAPNRYALLREWAFDGLEYNSARRCAASEARSSKVQTATLDGLARATLSEADRAAIARGCRPFAKQRAELLDCAEGGVFVEAYKRAWRATPSPHPAASRSALNSLMRNHPFVDRAIASAPKAVRLHISEMAASAVADLS
jgi:hypothetical protein